VKKSAAVPLTLVASFASALACAGPEAKQCVDDQQRVVPDSLCVLAERQQPGSTADTTRVASHRSGLGPGALLFIPYRYYYGGSRRGIGSVVSGGSFRPRSSFGSSSGSRSGVSRGGFGRTGGGRGFGG
jgi:hypothetical protein